MSASGDDDSIGAPSSVGADGGATTDSTGLEESESVDSRPNLRGLIQAAERNQVFEALFQVPAKRQQLGRYVVLGTLGRGGMGTVLVAFDRTLDRRVAVKVLHQRLAERHTRRLLREAQAMAQLSHPHVVQVYEAGEIDGQAFIAMELVQGQTLREWMDQKPRPGWRACVEVFLQVGMGLAAAHTRGLVHRDFKPGNAILDQEGRARVLDFGLARLVERGARTQDTPLEIGADDATLDAVLTRTGTMLGTPAYMPLEQMSGGEADARSDQFSFCASLYEAVYGERPYEGSTVSGLRTAMQQRRLRSPPRGIKVPANLRKALERGLSPDPEERWPSMETLLGELRRQVTPPARRWLFLLVAGGLTAAGVGLVQYAEVGFRCEGAEQQLRKIWDESRKRKVRAAILATDLSYAPETWERVEQRLDAYARDWVAKHTEVCRATRVTEEQSHEVMDVRMGCLSSRRIDLGAVVDVLTWAEPSRVEKAVPLVADLPALSRCDDVEALLARLPPPEDVEIELLVEVERERLAQVRALMGAGDYEGSEAMARDVIEEAEKLSYGPLYVEALVQRGRASHRTGKYAKAREDLRQAFLLALKYEHDEVQEDATYELANLTGNSEGNTEEGERWGQIALSLAEREGARDKQRAATLGVLGQLRRIEGKPGEALEYFERALAIEQERVGPRHPDLAAVMNEIGIVLLQQRRFEGALAYYQQAYGILVEALGSHHPSCASSLNNIAKVLELQGKPDEALIRYRQALGVLEEAFGSGHPFVAVTLNNMGSALQRQGNLDLALVYLERALAIEQESLGPRHYQIAGGLIVIGNVLQEQGKLDEALARYQEALAIGQESLGPEHMAVAGTSSNIGDVLVKQRRFDEAREHYGKALTIFERSLGPEHTDLAYALMGLAEVELARNDPLVARSYAERAMELREAGEVTPEERAEVYFLLARILWSDPAEQEHARVLAKRARELFAAQGEAGREHFARVRAWLIRHPPR
ncbi:MAG: tetratricopeptide repeat protein [Myxococcota bacterium]